MLEFTEASHFPVATYLSLVFCPEADDIVALVLLVGEFLFGLQHGGTVTQWVLTRLYSLLSAIVLILTHKVSRSVRKRLTIWR